MPTTNSCKTRLRFIREQSTFLPNRYEIDGSEEETRVAGQRRPANYPLRPIWADVYHHSDARQTHDTESSFVHATLDSDRLNDLPARLAADIRQLLNGDDLVGGIAIGIKGVVTGQTCVIRLLNGIDHRLAESLGARSVTRVCGRFRTTIDGLLNCL